MKKKTELAKKRSDARRGKKHTEESKKKISNSLSGDKSPMWGKKYTDEHKKNISDAKRGKHTGDKNPMSGKKHTDEAKEKITKNSARYWEGKKLTSKTDEILTETAAGIPLKRNATVADVVNAVMFFLSDESAFLTGVALDVDGGLLSTMPVPGTKE